MKFKKYNSIENSYRDKFIEKIREQGLGGGLFTVTEKVHGSNMSIWSDGEKTKYAKRTSFIGDQSFKGCNTIKFNMFLLMERVSKIYKGRFKEIVIYGEIAGGIYNSADPSVKELRDPHSKQVQKEVQYHPANIFYAFDISIDGEYVSALEFYSVMEAQAPIDNITYAKELFRGTLKECMEYENDYQSTVPALFELPKVEDNICEGNVIKPLDLVSYIGDNRVALKNKNPKFTEKEKSAKVKKGTYNFFTSPAQEVMIEEILQLVNENRLKNVLSKIGEVTSKDFGKIVGLFTKDALDEWRKDNEVSTADVRVLSKSISKECGNIVRDNILNIIDRTY